MQVYLDESGDLGWKFDAPYTLEGSSRYLAIAFIVSPKALSKYPKRIVSNLYKKYKILPGKEKKGSSLGENQKNFVVRKTIEMLEKHPEISIHSITVLKTKVMTHIREDPNKLYNFMIGLVLPEAVKDAPKVDVFPDPRTIKVKSGNSLVDYLQIKLWFYLNVSTRLHWHNVISKNSKGIQYADWIAYIIWSKYEYGNSEETNLLLPHISSKTLFF